MVAAQQTIIEQEIADLDGLLVDLHIRIQQSSPARASEVAAMLRLSAFHFENTAKEDSHGA